MKTIINGIGNFMLDMVFDPWTEMIRIFSNWSKIQDFLLYEWHWDYSISVTIVVLIACFVGVCFLFLPD